MFVVYCESRACYEKTRTFHLWERLRRGGRSSVCVQDPSNQAGNFPLCRESSMDRATRPNNPRSEPEMLPDRPLPTLVGMDPSPPPVEITSPEIPSSFVPTDTLDEASASFHSTPDFHHMPQTLSSHTYLEVPTPVPTTTHAGPAHSYTGPPQPELPPGTPPQFYTASHTGHSKHKFYTCYRVRYSTNAKR